MANPICDAFDRAEGRKTTPCGSKCKYFKFHHLETACVLSEVYSVKQGQPCYIFEAATEKTDKENDHG